MADSRFSTGKFMASARHGEAVLYTAFMMLSLSYDRYGSVLLHGIRAFCKFDGVVSLYPNSERQRTARVGPRPQAVEHVLKIISGAPAQIVSRPFIDVHSFDAGKHLPPSTLVFRLIIWNPSPQGQWRIRAQVE